MDLFNTIRFLNSTLNIELTSTDTVYMKTSAASTLIFQLILAAIITLA